MILELLSISCFRLSISMLNINALKKELNEELILPGWHPRRWWNFRISKDEEGDMKPTFIEHFL